jgi:GT2 family glycosyltransferase
MRDYKVYYGIPTYSQFAHTEEAVKAIYEGTIIPDQIVIIDNSETGAGAAALKHLPLQYPAVHIIPRTKNILSGAWNDLMNLWADDYIIIANDDVKPHKQSIEALINAAIDRPDVAMWNGSGHSGNSYSFFLLRKWAYAQVGRFDERFVPAYFEDNDYDYRLRIIAGLIREEVSNATFDHVGSATVRSMTQRERDQRDRLFRKAQQYYVSKWNGTPGQERVKVPFSGIDLSDL